MPCREYDRHLAIILCLSSTLALLKQKFNPRHMSVPSDSDHDPLASKGELARVYPIIPAEHRANNRMWKLYRRGCIWFSVFSDKMNEYSFNVFMLSGR
jgi:hypothetical protein